MGDDNTTIWILVFSFLVMYMCVQNMYIFYTILRVRKKMEDIHNVFVTTLSAITVLLSVTVNPCSILVMYFNDTSITHPWRCKVLLITIKLLTIQLPIVILTSLLWITVNFVLPMRSIPWNTSRNFYISYLTCSILPTVVYGVPAAVEQHIEQCEEPFAFPNVHHALAFSYSFCVPYLIIFISSLTYLFKKAKHLTMNTALVHNSLGVNYQHSQRGVQNLRMMTGIFIMATILTCLEFASMLLSLIYWYGIILSFLITIIY